MKRGQIALYVIITILIVAIGVSVFFISKQMTTEKHRQQIIDNIRRSIEGCLDEKVQETTRTIALSGFYANITNPAISDAFFFVTQYYYDGKNIDVPAKQNVEQQLVIGLFESNIHECFDFEKMVGMRVATEECKEINISIDNSIKATFFCPIKLMMDDKEYLIEDFYAEANLDVLKLLNYARLVTQQYAKDKPLLCTTCYNAIIANKNLTLNILPLYTLGENHTFFSLKDNTNNLMLIWAVK